MPLSTQLKIYDMPEKLVLVVNATEEEERGFTEEVGMRLKAVGFETAEAQRYVSHPSTPLTLLTILGTQGEDVQRRRSFLRHFSHPHR